MESSIAPVVHTGPGHPQIVAAVLALAGCPGDRWGMTRATDALGAYGERVATRTLAGAGMQILSRNWRCREGELDIVARDGDTIVFCEVKTRRGGGFGSPAEAVTHGKVRRLRTLAARWLLAHPDVRGEVRFDVLSIRTGERGAARVEHVRGAF